MPLIRFEFKYSIPTNLEDHLNCKKFKHHVLPKNTYLNLNIYAKHDPMFCTINIIKPLLDLKSHITLRSKMVNCPNSMS